MELKFVNILSTWGKIDDLSIVTTQIVFLLLVKHINMILKSYF